MRSKAKGEYPGLNLPFLLQAVYLASQPLLTMLKHFAGLPHIVEKGPEWFTKLSLTGEGGTKIYGVSGRVRNPGLWELPMGTSLRTIMEDYAGGMQEGYALKGIIPGGGSTDFMTADASGYEDGFCRGKSRRKQAGNRYHDHPG